MRLIVPTLILAAPLCAQAVAHGVPERGALLYDSTLKRETKIIAPDPAKVRHKWVHEVPNRTESAVLLHSDLGPKGRRLRGDPANLLQIGAHVAFDLTNWGRAKSFTRTVEMQPFGALRISGKSESVPMTAGGRQRIAVRVDEDPKGKKQARVKLRGEIVVDREFDKDRGIVTSFTADYRGELDYGSRRPDQFQRIDFTVTDTWKLRRIAANRDAKFNAGVGEAIRKGAEYLKKKIQGDVGKKFARAPDRGGQTKKSGELALYLLTLIKAGESPRDEVLAKALDDLRNRKIYDTYSLGVAMLVLEACYTPAGERMDLMSGRISAPYERKLSDADQRVMRDWVDQMLQNRTESSRDTLSRWHYLGGRGFDNSCTQYALLGLYAARLCGVDVDQKVWAGAARHFLRVQSKPDGKVRLSLTRNEQIGKKTSGRRTVSSVEARGWSYTGKYGNPTGSMTTAGIASLVICDAALGRKRRPRDISSSTLRGAIRSGFAWMSSKYDVRNNPGHQRSWYLYYLYGLERACELNQVAYIQGRDWYFDGATLLIESQQKDGRWGSDIDTCFAVLFLKKAALPVVTSKR